MSKARLDQTERFTGSGSWELSLGDAIVTYSSGFARILGLDADAAWQLDDFQAVVLDEDREQFAHAITQCVHAGAASWAFRAVRSNREIRCLRARAEAVTGADGQPSYVRGVLFDVTGCREPDRPQHVVALIERGFEAAPIGMAITDPSTGRYLQVNQAMCSLVGRPREELLRLTISDVTHPDDRARDADALRQMRGGAVQSFHSEKRYIRPDGSAVWAAVHVAPVCNHDGEVEAFFAQKIDITERKEREVEMAKYVSDAEWLGRIRDALDNDRMILYWQPIVDLRTGQTVQRELLLRMQDEDGTIVAPGVFLPVAERYGLVSEIDRWVIRQAVRLAADGTPTEFNVSAASVGDPDVVRELACALEETGADPSLLVVEVTETAMMDQPQAAQSLASQLQALGCGLALDDFGTGFATLSYLKHLRAEHLKIDIEFVRDVAHNETDQRVVRGIVGLAREFQQLTTAEGIEDEPTLEMLRQLGVDRGQGYLFARPMPLDPLLPSRIAAPTPSPGCSDPVSTIRAVFRAFADHDVPAAQQLCQPDVVLRPLVASQWAGTGGAYRGYPGLETYLRDVEEVWHESSLTPTAFWEVNGSVIALGYLKPRSNGTAPPADVIWVFRLREGRIASILTVDSPSGDKAPITTTR